MAARRTSARPRHRLAISSQPSDSGDSIQFGYTILYVDDVPATLAFYGKASGLATRYMHESGSYGELEAGATALAFVSHTLLRQTGKTPQPPALDKPAGEIALVTDDVAGAAKRALDAGATPVQEAKEMPWGQTIAYVGDSNGFLVEICTPVSHQAPFNRTPRAPTSRAPTSPSPGTARPREG